MNNIDKEIELLKLKIQLLEKEIELERVKQANRQIDVTVPYRAPYVGDVPYWNQQPRTVTSTVLNMNKLGTVYMNPITFK